MAHLKDPLLMNTHKVQRFCQEVVSQCFEKTFHQGHGEAIDPGPGGGIQGLPG